MKLEIIYFFSNCIIIYYQFIIASGTPLIGNNVRNAELQEFPFVVAFLRRNDTHIFPARDVVCAGTLISQIDVLSSEHCTTNLEVSGVHFIVGSVDVMRGLKFYPAWWISFDQWSVKNHEPIEYTDNDILMIRLTESVPEQIYATQLSTIPATRVRNLDTQVAGWGIGNNRTISRFLQTGIVRTLTNEACEERISRVAGHRITLENRAICTAADPYVLLNNGDSGGPLLHRGLVIGVNKGFCPILNQEFHPEQVNIHFSIEIYEDFILDTQNCL